MTEQTPAARRGRPRRKPPMETTDVSPVMALDRGLRIFSCLADMRRASLSAISSETGIPAPTVHRALATLQNRGLVSQDGTDGKWRIGPQAYRIGNAFEPGSNLLEIAPPIMRALAAETGETANLAIENGGALLYLVQVESDNPIRASIKNGTTTRFHTSGVGKIIMAHMDAGRLETLLRKSKLEAQTPKSITDVAQLKHELQRCRAQGWAIDDEERFLGMRCIAAPIFDVLGRVIAGLSISGPTTRFPDDQLEAMAARVTRAAAQISNGLQQSPEA